MRGAVAPTPNTNTNQNDKMKDKAILAILAAAIVTPNDTLAAARANRHEAFRAMRDADILTDFTRPAAFAAEQAGHGDDHPDIIALDLCAGMEERAFEAAVEAGGIAAGAIADLRVVRQLEAASADHIMAHASARTQGKFVG